MEMAQKVAFFAPMDAVVRDASVADLREKNGVPILRFRYVCPEPALVK